jgi:vancomycin resistance protein VanJ
LPAVAALDASARHSLVADPNKNFTRPLHWIAQGGVALALLASMLLVAGYRFGPERFWLLAFIAYLPYPIHLAPALAALMLSLVLRLAWRIAALVALVLVGWLAMGLELHRGESLTAGQRPVRVMTYNIKAYLAATRTDGFARLAQEIATRSPDILLLEDAEEPPPLRQSTPGPVAALLGARHRYVHGQFVIASRFPVRDCAPGIPFSQALGEAYVHCVVDIDGIEVDLYAVHLQTPRQGLNATRHDAPGGVDDWEQNLSERMAQAADLARAVRASKRPVIVGGDLNAPEVSLVVRTLLDTGLRDSFSSAGVGYGYTYGHALRPGFSFLRLDHVLVSAQIGVADCYAGGRHGSEHRPVIADLLLRRSDVPAPNGAADEARPAASSLHLLR